MQNQLIYTFVDAPSAYRFLNTLKHWSVAQVRAELYRDDATVRVTYEYASGEFDSTAARLDDEALALGGSEVG